MIDRRRFLCMLGAGAGAAALAPLAAWAKPPSRWPLPPLQPRIPAEVGRFGHSRIDPYAWLRPRDWHAVLADPASLDAPIRQAVEAENAYTRAMLEPTRPLQQALADRIAALEPLQAARLETRSGEYLYSVRHDPGSEYPRHVRRPMAGGQEQVLLDTNVEAGDSDYFALHWSAPVRSADGRLFGWAEDRVGSGRYVIRIRDVNSGRIVTEVPDAYGTFALSPDGRYLYWTGRDSIGRAATIHRRDLRDGSDVLLHEEQAAGFFITMRITASGRYLVIRTYDGTQAEVRLLPMRTPEAPLLLVEPRVEGVDYDVDDWNGKLLILTNADGAEDYKLMQADERAPGRAHWRPLVEHRPGHMIAAVHPFQGHLVREEWHEANPRLVLMQAGGGERQVAFDEPAYALRVPPGQDAAAGVLVFGYQSPRLPEVACALELSSGEVTRGPASFDGLDYDPERYEVRRLQARADDGEQVPVTVFMRRGTALDGSSPLLLSGYGSYGISMEARFEPGAVAMADRGWICALAHVRGGAEKGTRWWKSVLTTGKKTTFTDFIACAEHLIEGGYTARRRIVAKGMSAGGMLTGAVYAMRPDLWAGVIAEVAFVDVLNTMEHFDSHPLGAGAVPIWGDPRIPEEHAAMADWSPYEQLDEQADYPALLATGSVADERVSFWEPVKFAIKARALTSGSRPVMVRTAMASGHAGDSGASAERVQQARFLAFAVWAADDRWGGVPQRPE